jgi:hypothetical protein
MERSKRVNMVVSLFEKAKLVFIEMESFRSG